MPRAIRAASEDAGGRPVQVVGWCLGGILSLLALAADAKLPVASAALVASPFDFSKVPLVAPLRPIAAVTGGAGITQLYRLLGGAPAPLVKRGYQLAGIDKYVMKPWTVLSNLHDRELLAQIESVDAFMDAHARLSGAHLRPALPPLLPHQRPRRRPLRGARAGRSTSPTCASRCSPSPAAATASRRSRPAITSSRCCPTRAVRARDGAGRPPRRADRARRGRDDVADPRRRSSTRRVLQSAVHGGQNRGRPLPERLPFPPHARARPPHHAASPARPRRPRGGPDTAPRAAHRARRQGGRARRRQPHGRGGRGQAPADLRPAALQPRSPCISRARVFRLTPEAEQAEVRHGPDRQARLPRRAHQPRRRRPARHQREQGADPHLRPAHRPRGLPRAARRHDPHHAAPHLPPQGA